MARRAVKRSLVLMFFLAQIALWLTSLYPGWRNYSIVKITFIIFSVSLAYAFIIVNLTLIIFYCFFSLMRHPLAFDEMELE